MRANYSPSRCDRCHRTGCIITMSRFNTEMICTDQCEPKERAHPKYKEAHDAELREVRKGNYNFPGIGKPEDL